MHKKYDPEMNMKKYTGEKEGTYSNEK